MQELPSVRRPAPAFPRYLRLPLIAILAALSMGSGGGNPGCDSGDGPDECTGSCTDIAGTYALTFEDTSSIGSACESSGLSLPTELELSIREDILITRIQGIELEGTYYEIPYRDLYQSGDGTATFTDGTTIPFRIIIDGTFDAHPKRTTSPATFTAEYKLFHMDGSAIEPSECSVTRTVTGTRR